MSQQLIDQVLEQMLQDILNADFTAIEELIKAIPETNLTAYLPEKVTA
jgi:hypothetical protein